MSGKALLDEEDIWEYRSIGKRKSQCQSDAGDCTQTEQNTYNGKSKSKGSRQKKTEITSKNTEQRKKEAQAVCSIPELTPEKNTLSNWNHITKSVNGIKSPARPRTTKESSQILRPVHDGYCPNCQMPFSILLVQTPRWHVDECLDDKGHAEEECPDGLQCSSTIPSHYKRFTHFQLARSRACDDVTSGALASTADSSAGGPTGAVQASPAISESGISYSPLVSDEESEGEEKVRHLRKRLFSAQSSSSEEESEEERGPLGGSAKAGQCGFRRALSEEPCKEWNKGYNNMAATLGSVASQTCSTQCSIIIEEEEPETCSTEGSVIEEEPETCFTEGSVIEEEPETCFTEGSVIEEEPETCSTEGSVILIEEPETCTTWDSVIEEEEPETCSTKGSVIIKEEEPETCSTKGSIIKEEEPETCSNEGSVILIEEESEWAGFGSPVPNEGEWDRKGPETASWLCRELSSGATPLSKKVKAEEKMPLQSPLSSPSQQSQSRFHSKQAVCDSSQLGSDGAVSPSQSANLQSGANNEESSPLTQGDAERLLNLHVKKVRTVCVDPKAKAAPPKVLRQTDIGVFFFGLPPKAKEEKGSELRLSQRKKSASSGGTPKGNRAGQRKRKAGGSVSETDAVAGAPQSSEVSSKASGRWPERWPKKFREDDGTEGKSGKKKCPDYKKIPGTGFTVDAFRYGKIEGCTAYFLTHFHADHYVGLTKKFQCPVYCSKITANLVMSKLRVEERFIHTLPMDKECMVEGVKVVLLEANHCPGAVMLLFCLPNGTTILHTGDFRADPSMEQYPALIDRKIHTLYLDTTFCSPEYTFPPQQEVIQFAATTALKTIRMYPRTLVVCGSYTVGKEKVFLAVAGALGCKVCMSQDKYKTLQCLESEEIASQITTDWNSTSLHVLPLMQVNYKGLQSHLNRFSGRFDRILAFKPTGWTYTGVCASLAEIKPIVRAKITTYGIPYSEHSSYLEIKRFVKWLRPQEIISTVDTENWKLQSTMKKYFRQWMLEPAPKHGKTS